MVPRLENWTGKYPGQLFQTVGTVGWFWILKFWFLSEIQPLVEVKQVVWPCDRGRETFSSHFPYNWTIRSSGQMGTSFLFLTRLSSLLPFLAGGSVWGWNGLKCVSGMLLLLTLTSPNEGRWRRWSVSPDNIWEIDGNICHHQTNSLPLTSWVRAEIGARVRSESLLMFQRKSSQLIL